MKIWRLPKLKLPKFRRRAKSPPLGTVGMDWRVSEHQVVLRRPQQQSLWQKLRSKLPKRQQRVDAGAQFRSQRRHQQRLKLFSGVVGAAALRWRWWLISILILLVIAGLVALGVYLHRNETLVLKDIEVSGNYQISDLQILDSLNPLLGKSLLLISSDSVEADLRQKFPFIKSVYVRKLLPGKLEIQVEERYPVLCYINLAGAYLLDKEGVVADVVLNTKQEALTADELLVLNGFGDFNADYVRERYLATIEDETERAKVKWEEVSEENKKTTLDLYRTDIRTRVDSGLFAGRSAADSSAFAALPRMQAYDTKQYKVTDQFDLKRFNTVQTALKYLNDNLLIVQDILWLSDFSVQIGLANNPSLIFSAIRDIDLQVQTLQIIRERGDLNRASVVDLRGEVVEVH